MKFIRRFLQCSMQEYRREVNSRLHAIEIFLEPKNKWTYGDASGIIQLAIARGNEQLIHDGKHIGNKLLGWGLKIGDKYRLRPLRNDKGWGKEFHTFKVSWKPDDIMLQVDDKPAESIVPQGGQLFKLLGIADSTGQLSAGSALAPFDEEFRIKFGVTVGGLTTFPDESINADSNFTGTPKHVTWKNHDVKAMFRFWQKMSEWRSTWNGDDAALQIDYVKITAL